MTTYQNTDPQCTRHDRQRRVIQCPPGLTRLPSQVGPLSILFFIKKKTHKHPWCCVFILPSLSLYSVLLYCRRCVLKITNIMNATRYPAINRFVFSFSYSVVLHRCWMPTIAITNSASVSCCCACTAIRTPTRWSSGRSRCVSCPGCRWMASGLNAYRARRSGSRILRQK